MRRSLSAISGFRRGASREPSEELRSPTTAASWSRRRCPGLRRGGSAKARATAVGHRWGATSNARSCPSREVAPALGLRRRALLLRSRVPARSPRPGRSRRWGLRRLGNRSREASAGAKGCPLPGSRATGVPSGLPAASSQPPSTRCSPTTRSCPRCDASAQVGAAPKRLRVGAAAASRQRLAPQRAQRRPLPSSQGAPPKKAHAAVRPSEGLAYEALLPALGRRGQSIRPVPNEACR